MLAVENLMVFYEDVLAINNISLKCGDSEIVGVFGPNSAGKSTLMYTLSGIMLDIKKKEKMRGGERIATFGDVWFNGEDIADVEPSERARKGIILCPERRRIFAESSVLENLKIAGYLANRKEAKETCDYIFNLFPSLVALKKRQGGLLSGGEQQMLAIGRALMAQPKLLLLDEPLIGLSPAIQMVLVKAISQIKDRKQISILVTEQYARPVLPMVDFGYVLENGAAVLGGTNAELIGNPDVKAAYFGM